MRHGKIGRQGIDGRSGVDAECEYRQRQTDFRLDCLAGFVDAGFSMGPWISDVLFSDVLITRTNPK